MRNTEEIKSLIWKYKNKLDCLEDVWEDVFELMIKELEEDSLVNDYTRTCLLDYCLNDPSDTIDEIAEQIYGSVKVKKVLTVSTPAID
ncbi:MAG: hypothetical protein ACO3MB_05855 [Saprospiraceae bacterium]